MPSLILPLLGCLFFCTSDFPIDLMPEQFTYQSYQSGQPTQQPKTITTARIRDFFRKEQKGWQRDLTTYAPGDRLTSSHMSINILPDIVVLNYRPPMGQYRQVSKTIDTTALTLILNSSP